MIDAKEEDDKYHDTQASSEIIDEKKDQENQEGHILLSEFFDNAETILNQLKTMTLVTIIFKEEQNLKLVSKYEESMLKNYKNRMEFYISCLFDPQFDIFTPPRKNYFDNYDIFLFFEFYETQFKIIANVNSGLSVFDIAYELNALPILECLETGVMSKELFCMLEKMKFRNYDNGNVISKCTDFRLKPKKEFLIKFKAINSI